MRVTRFQAISSRYPALRLAVVGDFCLDRYLEIDPAKPETSIETGLAVHNVVQVRSQPGAAGTILNNLAALGVGEIYPVGFCGEDGEGFELRRSLRARRGVNLDYFIETDLRRTFTYCKPLLLQQGQPPRELNRLDSKNWTATPNDIFDFPRTRSRKAIGISRTRSVRPPWTIVSKAILKPLAGGASSSNRERGIAKKPHMESCTPVSG